MKVSISLLPAIAGLALAQNPLADLIASQPDLSTLLDALSYVPELAATLAGANNITILAPVNSAFAAVPPDTAEGLALSSRDPNGTSTLLNYHVIQGTYPSSAFTNIPNFVPTFFDNRSITFDNARTNVTGGQNLGLVRNENQFQIISGELQTSNVIQADITVGGITIHKLDEVLTIPLNVSDTVERLNATAAQGALTQAGLIDQLDIVPDLTIFVPNNDAFQAAGSAFAGASVETLRDVLQYHAITGSVVFSQDITNTTVQASNGGTLTLSVVDGEVYVNSARVVLPNVLLSDGVVHVIDAVLNPANGAVNRDELDDDDTPTPAFAGASATGNVPFTSAVPAPTTLNSIPPIYTTADFVGTVGTGAVRPTSTGVVPFTGAAAPTAVVGGFAVAGAALVGAWELAW